MEAASIPALRKLEPGSSPPLGLFLAGNLWDSRAEESRPQGHALPGSTQESTPFQALSPQAFHSQAQEDFGTSMRMTSPRHLPHRCGLRPQQQVNVVYEHRQSTAGGQDHHVVRGQVRLSRYRNCLELGFGAQWAPPFGHAWQGQILRLVVPTRPQRRRWARGADCPSSQCHCRPGSRRGRTQSCRSDRSA